MKTYWVTVQRESLVRIAAENILDAASDYWDGAEDGDEILDVEVEDGEVSESPPLPLPKLPQVYRPTKDVTAEFADAVEVVIGNLEA